MSVTPMKMVDIFSRITIGLLLLILNIGFAWSGAFDPPSNKEVIDLLKSKPGGERLLNRLNLEEGIDYPGRRFTDINNARTHFIKKSRLFKEGTAIYITPPMARPGIEIVGPKIFSTERRTFIGQEQVSDTGQPLPPKLFNEIKTLNDVAGFVKITSKKDAIEYARVGSSSLTFNYFTPQMQEVFCVSKVQKRSNGIMMTFGDCARLGLKPPKVKIVKSPEVEVHSNPSKTRFKMTSKSKRPDVENGEVDEDADTDDGVGAQFFYVSRNVEIDSENAIFRITEEVGRNGEWRIVEKKLIHHF